MALLQTLLLLGLVLAGSITVITVNTANSEVDPFPKADWVAFPEQVERFQTHPCGCKNDWPLATNERNISNEIFAQDESIPDPRGLTFMVPALGQFVDHDIVLSQSDATQGMFEIIMEPGNTTLVLTRAEHRNNSFGCREFVSVATPEIDASTVYGSTNETLAMVRNASSCKLRMEGGFLPLEPNSTTSFLAGDPRNTEHSILASIHTLWVLEHNLLCDEMPSDWSEEDKFWKARQVLIAKLQHIVYEEWLPTLFGSQTYLLYSGPDVGQGTDILMEFSVSAYRFGHSQIPDLIGAYQLTDLFHNRQAVLDYGIDSFIEAAYETAAEKVDTKIIDGLRNFMFAAGPNEMGEDLVTRNLFRQRDGGIVPYSEYRTCYGLGAVEGNEEEASIGILSESLAQGSSLTPTLARVLAEQFRRLKVNDPNFYTRNAGRIGSHFWNAVQQTRMSTIIRRNTQIESVPENVFLR